MWMQLERYTHVLWQRVAKRGVNESAEAWEAKKRRMMAIPLESGAVEVLMVLGVRDRVVKICRTRSVLGRLKQLRYQQKFPFEWVKVAVGPATCQDMNVRWMRLCKRFGIVENRGRKGIPVMDDVVYEKTSHSNRKEAIQADANAYWRERRKLEVKQWEEAKKLEAKTDTKFRELLKTLGDEKEIEGEIPTYEPDKTGTTED